MTYAALRSNRFPRRESRRRRNRAILALSVGALGVAGLRLAGTGEAPASSGLPTQPTSLAAQARPAQADYAWMLDPTPALGGAAPGLSLSAPLGPDFRLAAAILPQASVTVAEAGPPVEPEPARAALTPERVTLAAATPIPPAAPSVAASLIPLPVPRPPEFRRGPVAVVARLASRAASPSTQSVFRAARVEEPSLLDRIFGGGEAAPAEPALAYASVESGAVEAPARRTLFPDSAPVAEAATAIYDISAQRVTLPSGEVLEAHSGLGPSQDNPRHVHLTMRGATPPGTYDLREREALFHGVRAIRLNPVGGPGAIHGRNGLLAHTYMLGPSGASNGCVVFRDYNRFLQAYLRGEVRRLVVVAGRGWDGPREERRIGLLGRAARRG